MRDKAEIAAVFHTILGVLKNAKENQGNPMHGAPNGHLYAQLIDRYDINTWTRIINVLKEAGHIAESNHFLTILPKGETFYAELDAIYKEGEAKMKGKVK